MNFQGLYMSIHHTLEEKKESIRLHASVVSMIELMTRFHVRDYYLYILWGQYEKYSIDGLESCKKKLIVVLFVLNTTSGEKMHRTTVFDESSIYKHYQVKRKVNPPRIWGIGKLWRTND